MNTHYLAYGKGNRYRVLRYFPQSGAMARSYGKTGEGSYTATKCVKLWGLVQAVRTWCGSNGREDWIEHPSDHAYIVAQFVESATKAGFSRLGAFNIGSDGSVTKVSVA